MFVSLALSGDRVSLLMNTGSIANLEISDIVARLLWLSGTESNLYHSVFTMMASSPESFIVTVQVKVVLAPTMSVSLCVMLSCGVGTAHN